MQKTITAPITIGKGSPAFKVLVRTVSLTCCFCLYACAGGQGGSPPPPPPPAITIKSIATFYPGNNSLDGTYAIAGQGSFTLLVNGIGFTESSVVAWNGHSLPTQFGDSTDLAASVSSSLISAPGKATITVNDPGASSNLVVLAIASPAAATAGVVALVTAATDGTPANGDSLVAPSISATGRYVAFQSNATNLAPGPASGYQEIYERDTCIGELVGCTPNTIRITVTYDGLPADFHSRASAISADGRYVAFDSQATNIIPGSGVCGGISNCVFVRDTCIGVRTGCVPATFAVSVDAQGRTAPGSGPQMTPDARFISFGSSASALGLGTATVGDVFVRDTCIGVASGCTPSTIWISMPSDGSQGDQNSELQAISSSGRFAGFLSWADNMVANETVAPEMFWRDTCLGAGPGCTTSTVRVDVSTSGAPADQPAVFGPFPAISADGRLVAFGSGASNLVSPSFCTQKYGCGNVYVRDTCTGTSSGCAPSTSLVSIGNDGAIGNCYQGGSPGNLTNVSLSADGRFVAFGSISTNLTPDDNYPACGWEDIFVRDTCFGASDNCAPSSVRVSVANTTNPGISANDLSVGNAMTADGHYAVFISAATNLLSGVLGNGHSMVYLAKTGF